MSKRQTFKDILKEARKNPLKIVEDDSKLPYIFDLYWDAKYGSDLDGLVNNPETYRYLCENGYDAKEWKERKTKTF